MKKIAIVHDWMITVGGAEKVLKQFMILYPTATVFCMINKLTPQEEQSLLIDDKTKNLSLLNRFPLIKKN